MRVAVFGFYHADNFGDDRLMQMWVRLLREHQCTFFQHHAPPSLGLLREFELILIGGGGLVWNHVGIWKDVRRWTTRCGIPVGVAGLGVNQAPGELEEEMAALVDRSEFFFVRDEKSKRLLGAPDTVQVAPDLSWLFPFDSGPTENGRGIAVNLCPRASVDPDSVRELLAGETLLPFPLYLRAKEDLGYLEALTGGRVASEFRLTPLLESEMAVVCRYHAVQFAVQIGKPFLAIIYDDKVRRFLGDHGLSDLAIEPDQVSELKQRIAWLRSNRDEISGRLEKTRQRLLESAEELRGAIIGRIGQLSGQRAPFAVRLRRRLSRMLFG